MHKLVASVLLIWAGMASASGSEADILELNERCSDVWIHRRYYHVVIMHAKESADLLVWFKGEDPACVGDAVKQWTAMVANILDAKKVAYEIPPFKWDGPVGDDEHPVNIGWPLLKM